MAAIQYQELYDKTVMRMHMRKIAKAVAGNANGMEVEGSDTWFAAEPDRSSPN